MIVLFAFWSILIGALAIGWQAGDRRDRFAILAIGGSAVATAAADLLIGGRGALALVGLVDIALLAVMVRLALITPKHWPIWFAGIHATAVLMGVAGLSFPTEQRIMLEFVSGFWAIPALAVMVIGLLADQRNGIADRRKL